LYPVVPEVVAPLAGATGCETNLLAEPLGLIQWTLAGLAALVLTTIVRTLLRDLRHFDHDDPDGPHPAECQCGDDAPPAAPTQE
jgi:hypothetical protein